MTVSMRVMSVGDGYKYLLKSVAAGDGDRSLSTPLTRYYAEAGSPPGFWLGSGITGFGMGNLTDHLASVVPNRRHIGTLRGAVDAALPPCHKGFQPRGKVQEKSQAGPRLGQVQTFDQMNHPWSGPSIGFAACCTV
ncbi:TrwC relaxase [Bifidobacterium psychraerophilum DSM 22366]|uniref:Conjugative relaxase n=2 Tax=Bifidobacterium psychraerophilum TaxID=218140 RepID=A0A087CCM1_9BIFI|nr:conjugative relaxase [Bifidobacterium psychraerophilum]PKA95370.1 TrwC relaxase [Bifidobacterium psychraerophilum DSM 22366]